jgi:hypothetical protein
MPFRRPSPRVILHSWLIQDLPNIISIFDEVAGHPEYRVAEMAVALPTGSDAVMTRYESVDLTAQISIIRMYVVVV